MLVSCVHKINGVSTCGIFQDDLTSYVLRCIHLPSQRTLQDCTHYIPAKVGFSAEVNQQLIDTVDFSKETNRYVVLFLDEVHIKEDLVYNKHGGLLIGFANVGDINNYLMNFERSLTDKLDETIPSIV